MLCEIPKKKYMYDFFEYITFSFLLFFACIFCVITTVKHPHNKYRALVDRTHLDIFHFSCSSCVKSDDEKSEDAICMCAKAIQRIDNNRQILKINMAQWNMISRRFSFTFVVQTMNSKCLQVTLNHKYVHITFLQNNSNPWKALLAFASAISCDNAFP